MAPCHISINYRLTCKVHKLCLKDRIHNTHLVGLPSSLIMAPFHTTMKLNTCNSHIRLQEFIPPLDPCNPMLTEPSLNLCLATLNKFRCPSMV